MKQLRVFQMPLYTAQVWIEYAHFAITVMKMLMWLGNTQSVPGILERYTLLMNDKKIAGKYMISFMFVIPG